MLTFTPSSKLKPYLSDPKKPFIHRDLSWLQFNARVLGEAQLKTNPVLERVKFLAISSSNLDEFFMIRLAALGRSISAQLRKDDKAQVRRLTRIRSVILNSVSRFKARQAETLMALAAELKTLGIYVLQSSDEAQTLGKKVFEERILPDLELPQPFSPAQLSLLDNLQLGVIFDSNTWFRIPKKIRPIFTVESEITGAVYFFFLDQLLAEHLGPAFRIESPATVVRLTRDADFNVDIEEEDPESIPDIVLSTLGRREKGRPVRLQYLGDVKPETLETFHKALKIKLPQFFKANQTLCMHGLWSALSGIRDDIRNRDGLMYPPLSPQIALSFRTEEGVFDAIRTKDYLFHHPYDSFDAYVNWIRAACSDPKVTMVEQTVYRMDTLSPVLDALKAAASKKRVRVVIELRARFDELNNLRLTDDLRKAGVEVAFGFGKLKLHAKVALVTRQEEDGPRLYTHLSTGNYNAVTARQYTDLAILTANPEIGEDARHFFSSLWKKHAPTSFKRLVPAPSRLHRRVLQLIDAEIAAAKSGLPARIFSKVNTLVDESVIESLYNASNAGVQVDLIVRGACSLIPGVKGLSENIRVYSIVDRFLEHSRIYYFSNSKAMYLSSADWMPRNFFSRLELAFPVLDDRLYNYIETIVIPTYLNDKTNARILSSDGRWKKRSITADEPVLRSQFYFEALARNEYKGTPLGQNIDISAPRSSLEEARPRT